MTRNIAIKQFEVRVQEGVGDVNEKVSMVVPTSVLRWRKHEPEHVPVCVQPVQLSGFQPFIPDAAGSTGFKVADDAAVRLLF